jgi:hypothetical protein
MCIIENSDLTLDQVFDDLYYRLKQDNINIERVKKLYRDTESFDLLINQLIQKDAKRFEKNISNLIRTGPKDDKQFFPTPWRIFGYIVDIVQNEGTEIKPFDTLTRMLPSRSLSYYGWTFTWVHGMGTLVSIYNRKNELVYRF